MAGTAPSSPAKQTPKVVYKQKVKTAGPAGHGVASSAGGSYGKSRGLSKLAIAGLALGFIVLFFNILDQFKERFYIFSPARLRELQLQTLQKHGNNTRAVIDEIVSTLRAEQPEWAISKKEEWVFNNAGGAMGGMYIIHASLTEYLIIFGTPIGTEGHTGRHTADDYFHILTGEQTAYRAGSLEAEVYPAGTVHHLRRGEVKQYKFHDGGFAMEYAVGLIPPMLFFGYADGLSSTLDVGTLWETTRLTGREMIRNMLHGKL